MLLKNAWNNTTPVCAVCGKEMTLDTSSSQFMYKCCDCRKQFSINYFEKILDNIAALDAQRQLVNDISSLEGEKFTIARKIKCEIIEENTDMSKWKVSIKVLS